MVALDGVTVEELTAIRNAFDQNHRLSIQEKITKHGGTKIKDIPIEFDPLASVESALIVTVNQVYKGALGAVKLIYELGKVLLDTAHNAAIMLLDWAGLHQFVLMQFDALIKERKAA